MTRMKLAVISDIHGNLPALQAVLDGAHERGRPDRAYALATGRMPPASAKMAS
jgi:Icc-related predicted phosphoesterase